MADFGEPTGVEPEESVFKFDRIEQSGFDGNPKDPDEILEFLLINGYTHMTVTGDGEINFHDERDVGSSEDINESPERYLPLTQPEAKTIMAEQINKGLKFEMQPVPGFYSAPEQEKSSQQ